MTGDLSFPVNFDNRTIFAKQNERIFFIEVASGSIKTDHKISNEMWFSMVATSLSNLKCSNLIVDLLTICHENKSVSIHYRMTCFRVPNIRNLDLFTFLHIQFNTKLFWLFSVAFAFYSFVVEIKKNRINSKFYLWDHYLFYSVPNFKLIVFAK